MDFMTALGGRKNFGFLVSVLTLSVVAVFAPGANFGELAAAVGGIFAVFVGGNVVNTLKAPVAKEPEAMTTVSESPDRYEDLDRRLALVELTANEANETANQAGEAAFKIHEQVQAIKNTIAVALNKRG
jgi:hypothetical protein